MAKADKLKKKIKKLTRKLEQKPTLPNKAKKEIKQLKRALKESDRIITGLRLQLSEQRSPSLESAETILTSVIRDKKLVIGQKNAWKRHTFLGECYEQHLDNGHDKEQARSLANQDLMDRYGDDVGFTPEQLLAILS